MCPFIRMLRAFCFLHNRLHGGQVAMTTRTTKPTLAVDKRPLYSLELVVLKN